MLAAVLSVISSPDSTIEPTLLTLLIPAAALTLNANTPPLVPSVSANRVNAEPATPSTEVDDCSDKSPVAEKVIGKVAVTPTAVVLPTTVLIVNAQLATPLALHALNDDEIYT